MMAAGALDPEFSGDGVVTTQLGTRSSFVTAIAIQPDGRIIAAGTSNGSKTDRDFTLVRYRNDGTLDNTFGSGGKVATAMGKKSESINALALQTDGKIIAAGGVDLYNGPSYPFDSNTAFALARYNINGTLDTSFGNRGKVIHDWNPNEDDGIRDIALLPDGRFVVVGVIGDSQRANPGNNLLVARYTAAGSLDASFGAGGRVMIDLGGDDNAFGLKVQPDGKLVIAGFTNIHGTYDFMVLRLNSNATSDTSFGNNGVVLTDVVIEGESKENRAYDVQLQTDGKIVVAGSNYAYGGSVIARYNADGSLDTTFGQDRDENGVRDGMTLSHSIENGEDLAIDPAGRIVVAGMHWNPDSLDPASGSWDTGFAIARYNPDGLPDLAIGSNGVVRLDLSGTDYDEAMAVAIQADGKIVAAGFMQFGNRYDFAVIRLSPGNSQPSDSIASSETSLRAAAVDVALVTELQQQAARKRRRSRMIL
jgi:uncharacterized delta-60 repeat protein